MYVYEYLIQTNVVLLLLNNYEYFLINFSQSS